LHLVGDLFELYDDARTYKPSSGDQLYVGQLYDAHYDYKTDAEIREERNIHII